MQRIFSGEFRCVCPGAYVMDRLRYEAYPQLGQLNQAPAVRFLRKAVKVMDADKINIGTMCHSLWLFCSAPELFRLSRNYTL